MFNKTLIPALMCASLALGACGTVYDRVAERGNGFCDKKPNAVGTLKDDVNASLREAGARFEFKGIACD